MTAIAALPAHPPVTEQQALAEGHAVDRFRSKDTMLEGIMHIVGLTLFNLGRDIAGGRNTSAARVTYNVDVFVVKSYCRARRK
jgi:hypothetical protein